METRARWKVSNPNKVGARGIELIQAFEGFRADAYLCPAKVWTIGYGHTAGVKKGQTVTKEQALDLLRQDLAWVELALATVGVPLNQNEYDALASFVFNVGAGAFGKSTLRRLLVTGSPRKVVAEQFMRWTKGGGRVLSGLVRRREAERALFLAPVNKEG